MKIRVKVQLENDDSTRNFLIFNPSEEGDFESFKCKIAEKLELPHPEKKELKLFHKDEDGLTKVQGAEELRNKDLLVLEFCNKKIKKENSLDDESIFSSKEHTGISHNNNVQNENNENGGVHDVDVELESCLQLAQDNKHLDTTTKTLDKCDDNSGDVEDGAEEKDEDRCDEVVVDIATDEDTESETDTDNANSISNALPVDDLNPKPNKRVRKKPPPKLQVLIDKKDDPKQETSTVEDQIMKLLNHGFDKLSNKDEFQKSMKFMKIAHQLIRTHNLSLLMQDHKKTNKDNKNYNEEVLEGGKVKVRIKNRKSQKPSQHAEWFIGLRVAVSKVFNVKSSYEKQRGKCDVTFFGIYINCRLAGYAFRVAVERISELMDEYKPCKTTNSRKAKASFALNIVLGIYNEVMSNMKTEKQKLVGKVERAQKAASFGEKYEEIDDDDDVEEGSFPSDDNDDDDSASGGNAPGKNRTDEDDNDHEIKKPPAAIVGKDKLNRKNVLVLMGAALNQRLRELETELFLADHEKKVADHEKKVAKEEAKKAAITFDQKKIF